MVSGVTEWQCHRRTFDSVTTSGFRIASPPATAATSSQQCLPGRGQERASAARRSRQALVDGGKLGIQSLRHGHVPGIVGGHVRAQFPDSLSEGSIGKQRHPQCDQVGIASAAASCEISPARAARRRTLAASTGIRCGAARSAPDSSSSAHRPSVPPSASAATTNPASTTRLIAGPRRGGGGSLCRQPAAGTLLAFPDTGHERFGVRAARQLDKLHSEVFLQRPPGRRGAGSKLCAGIVRDVANRNRLGERHCAGNNSIMQVLALPHVNGSCRRHTNDRPQSGSNHHGREDVEARGEAARRSELAAAELQTVFSHQGGECWSRRAQRRASTIARVHRPAGVRGAGGIWYRTGVCVVSGCRQLPLLEKFDEPLRRGPRAHRRLLRACRCAVARRGSPTEDLPATAAASMPAAEPALRSGPSGRPC